MDRQTVRAHDTGQGSDRRAAAHRTGRKQRGMAPGGWGAVRCPPSYHYSNSHKYFPHMCKSTITPFVSGGVLCLNTPTRAVILIKQGLDGAA